MTAINHVLVPTEGPAGAIKAAAFAAELARALDARISVLFVLSEDLVVPHGWGAGGYPTGAPYGTMSVEEIRSMIEQQIREKELTLRGQYP